MLCAPAGLIALAGLLFIMAPGSALCGQETGVPVMIDGQEVARVYGLAGTFTAAERAPETSTALFGWRKRDTRERSTPDRFRRQTQLRWWLGRT